MEQNGAHSPSEQSQAAPGGQPSRRHYWRILRAAAAAARKGGHPAACAQRVRGLAAIRQPCSKHFCTQCCLVTCKVFGTSATLCWPGAWLASAACFSLHSLAHTMPAGKAPHSLSCLPDHLLLRISVCAGRPCRVGAAGDRAAQRKAARVALDTSARAGTAYHDFVRQLEPGNVSSPPCLSC